MCVSPGGTSAQARHTERNGRLVMVRRGTREEVEALSGPEKEGYLYMYIDITLNHSVCVGDIYMSPPLVYVAALNAQIKVADRTVTQQGLGGARIGTAMARGM